MKLKEFLKLNHQIGELQLEVRDYSNGGAKLIETYRIGSHVLEDRKGNRWVSIIKPINLIESVARTGNAYWGHILEPIPKRLQEMEVKGFDFGSTAFWLNNNLWELKKCRICLVGTEVDVLELAKEKDLEDNPDVDENGQLRGQMSFM